MTKYREPGTLCGICGKAIRFSMTYYTSKKLKKQVHKKCHTEKMPSDDIATHSLKGYLL